MDSTLTPLELAVMRAVWSSKSATVRHVHTKLRASRRELAYTTVATVLDRLQEKGNLRCRLVRGVKHYSAQQGKLGMLTQTLRSAFKQYQGTNLILIVVLVLLASHALCICLGYLLQLVVG